MSPPYSPAFGEILGPFVVLDILASGASTFLIDYFLKKNGYETIARIAFGFFSFNCAIYVWPIVVAGILMLIPDSLTSTTNNKQKNK